MLGLDIETEGEYDMEFPCGQVTLDIFDLEHRTAASPSPAGLRSASPMSLRRGHIEAKGVEFDGETIETGVCKQAWFKDPDGNALMLHRRFDV